MTVSNEAIGEFTLLQNQFAPEFGGGSGGIFNAVVKSGTNQVHGNIYEYLQNRNLNAVDSYTWTAGLTSNLRYDNNGWGPPSVVHHQEQAFLFRKLGVQPNRPSGCARNADTRSHGSGLCHVEQHGRPQSDEPPAVRKNTSQRRPSMTRALQRAGRAIPVGSLTFSQSGLLQRLQRGGGHRLQHERQRPDSWTLDLQQIRGHRRGLNRRLMQLLPNNNYLFTSRNSTASIQRFKTSFEFRSAAM